MIPPDEPVAVHLGEVLILGETSPEEDRVGPGQQFRVDIPDTAPQPETQPAPLIPEMSSEPEPLPMRLLQRRQLPAVPEPSPDSETLKQQDDKGGNDGLAPHSLSGMKSV